MNIMQIIWLVLLVIFAVLEGVTVALVSAWFCLGALAAFVVSLIAPGAVAVQVIVFLLVTGATIFGLRPLFRRMVGNRKVATNADANIGKICQVLTEVQPGRFGRVKIEGKEWTAKSDHVLPVGSWCRVNAIEGVKLVVSPVEGTPPPKTEYDFQ